MKINNIIKLFIIKIKLDLVRLKSALFILALMFILLSLFMLWWKRADMLKPTVLIANEERGMLANLTINSILNNKISEIVNFKTSDFTEGKHSIDSGDALLLVYIKKGTINTLYEGKKAEISIYTKNENNDFTKLIISYIKGFTDIINVSQNAGLAYMNVLYQKGMNEAERIDKFNELQSSYVRLTLARNHIFKGEDKMLGLTTKDIRLIYYLILAVFLIGLSLNMFSNSEIRHKNMRERFVLSGINELEIYFTVLVGIFITNIVFILFFGKLAKIIGIGD